MSDNWTKDELRASVEAYLEIQRELRAGRKVVKKDFYKALAKRFKRTEKAYEYRMQNISYVMSISGREWISGLRPARNVGARVAAEIEAILANIEERAASPHVAFETQVQLEVAKRKLKRPSGNKAPNKTTTQTTNYERDPDVKAWVLITAKGFCECCRNRAPFVSADGTQFLEVHHVRRLADEGSDTVENAVALCPNCHREFHHGSNSRKLVDRIYATVARLVRE